MTCEENEKIEEDSLETLVRYATWWKKYIEEIPKRMKDKPPEKVREEKKRAEKELEITKKLISDRKRGRGNREDRRPRKKRKKR